MSVLGDDLELDARVIHVPKANADSLVRKIVLHLLPEEFRQQYQTGQVIAFGNHHHCLSPIELNYWFDKNPQANFLNIKENESDT